MQDENGISDFEALRSAIHKARHRLVLFAFDPRCPIQFSDHVVCDGLRFFKAAAELGLEGIVSKRASSLYRPGPSRNWLKTKNMVESEFVLLGTEIDDSGMPWALLAQEGGELEFVGPAIFRTPSQWAEKFAAMSIEKPALKGMRRANKTTWPKPEIRVRAQHLRAKGSLRHASVTQLLID